MKASKGLGITIILNAIIFMVLGFMYLLQLEDSMTKVLLMGSEAVGFGDAWVQMVSGLIPIIIVFGLSFALTIVVGLSIYKGTFVPVYKLPKEASIAE
jgi:hypothetical protein